MSTATPIPVAPDRAPDRPFRHAVDVWEVTLEPCGREPAFRVLSGPERAVAARRRVAAEAWVAAHVALRRVLGRYLGIAPARVALETGANGKPRLAPGRSPDLRFNLSHSGNLALIAVRLGLEVGVDVEARRPGVDGAAIARHVLLTPDRAAEAALDAGASGDRFFRAWVRGEALAKATGLGIASRPAPDDTVRFEVRDLDGIPGFAAAVASEGHDWNVRRVGPFSVSSIGMPPLHARVGA